MADNNALFINKQVERVTYTILRQIMRRLALNANIQDPSLPK